MVNIVKLQLTIIQKILHTTYIESHGQREKNLVSRVALLPGKFLPSGKFFFIYMIFFGQNPEYFLIVRKIFIFFGKVSRQYLLPDKFPTRFRKNSIYPWIFPDTMEKFNLFWKFFGQYLLTDKFPTRFRTKFIYFGIFLDCMEKDSVILEKFPN